MLVNITKAAKLAGIGRETLYKGYINQGKLSVTRDERDRPMVDTSEILRVFGRLQGTDPTHNGYTQTPQNPTPQDTQPHTQDTPDFLVKIAQLQAENAQLRERLEEAKERERWHQEQAGKLADTIKLLDAPRKGQRSWWKLWR